MEIVPMEPVTEVPIPDTAKMTLLPSSVPINQQEAMSLPPPHVIHLKGNHIDMGRSIHAGVVIHSLQISRKHCAFEYKDSKWYIQDFSTNGIGINGVLLPKHTSKEILNGDVINLIPAGLLSYKFEYIQIHPARPNREPCPEVVAVMDMEQLHGQAGEVDGNVSDESESLLSIGNGEDSIESDPAVDINENDMGKVFSSNHDMPVEDVKSAGHKRSCEVLKPQNKAPTKRGCDRVGTQHKRLKADSGSPALVTIGDEGEEELLDLDDEPVVILSSPRKDQRPEQSPTVAVRNGCSPIKSAPPVIISPPKEEKSTDTLEKEVLTTQLKYFTSLCKELKAEKSLLTLNHNIDQNKLKEELTQLKSELATQTVKEGKIYKDIASLMDVELSCCVCNEVFINATVIDCGHTFCNKCILEWEKKTRTCPICRTAFTRTTKHVELNNFILKIHSILPVETQEKRSQLVREREEEVSIAQVVDAARKQERTPVRGNVNLGRRGTGGLPDNYQELYLNQLEQFHLRDLDLADLGLGDLFENFQANQRAGGRGARVATGPSNRRSPRRSAARGRPMTPHNLSRNNAAAAGGAGIPPVLTPPPPPRRRSGNRGRAAAHRRQDPPPAAAGAPALITIDDGQDGAPVHLHVPPPPHYNRGG